ncbi:hypothetical protein LOZ58_002213 [Ophidiomyces ophidiicola]|nr:hypothetical protein LOZ65_002386 [Ophidiomyces ophidiicola]KAI1937680.1 hypothetical protein LOZ66_003961 [Ophidiomyces ophidiicola]KAI1963380.1 hypothetical protein LOZ58_002213 [Ophidiomyces ophidiicola]
MPVFVNPFKRNDLHEYPGVLIPLAQERNVEPSSALHRKDADENSAETGSVRSSQSVSKLTIEALRAEVESDVATNGHDTPYDRKSKIINRAIQDIGMGRYQWELFILCGFGWTADNLWLQGVALTLPPLAAEFGITESHVRFTTCSLFIGLCIGAVFWGTASDIIGRRLAFNVTLLLTAVFGLAAGGGPSWIGVCSLFACLGLGVGGNLPVDGALFLEFLPFASGNLLTMLSVWWPVGQLVGSLVAWGFVPQYSCKPNTPCRREDNMGWRYLVLTLGSITFLMFICRFFLFHLYESPKYLLSRGRQAEAVATVHAIAHKNKAKTWLTVEILNEIGGNPDEEATSGKLSTGEVIKRQLVKFSGDRIAPLFADRRMAITTLLLWFCWSTIGMGYPLFNAFLPQYLGNQEATSTAIVYRNYAITSIVGVPGSIIACYTVDIPYIGRKGTMAISTCITGIILFCFTISREPNAQLACACLEAFFQNIMYGVLYAYTPEVFPAPNRGTGTGIASCLNRICGLLAPIVAIYAGNTNPNAPVYASGGLFLAAFVAMCLLPIETRGKQAL